jgi:hypothetical protein
VSEAQFWFWEAGHCLASPSLQDEEQDDLSEQEALPPQVPQHSPDLVQAASLLDLAEAFFSQPPMVKAKAARQAAAVREAVRNLDMSISFWMKV